MGQLMDAVDLEHGPPSLSRKVQIPRRARRMKRGPEFSFKPGGETNMARAEPMQKFIRTLMLFLTHIVIGAPLHNGRGIVVRKV